MGLRECNGGEGAEGQAQAKTDGQTGAKSGHHHDFILVPYRKSAIGTLPDNGPRL
ncbi:hypothetical protein D3C76_1604370 [compost metagenome]